MLRTPRPPNQHQDEFGPITRAFLSLSGVGFIIAGTYLATARSQAYEAIAKVNASIHPAIGMLGFTPLTKTIELLSNNLHLSPELATFIIGVGMIALGGYALLRVNRAMARTR